jgi:hypothetical protein
MKAVIQTAITLLRERWRQVRGDDGTTAIEWAIFALLALTLAGIVAAAITAAVNHRIPGIQ